jgi:hypothetical protein
MTITKGVYKVCCVVGWMDSKPVNQISSADITAIGLVRRRVQNKKVDVTAPEVVVNYNQ